MNSFKLFVRPKWSYQNQDFKLYTPYLPNTKSDNSSAAKPLSKYKYKYKYRHLVQHEKAATFLEKLLFVRL